MTTTTTAPAPTTTAESRPIVRNRALAVLAAGVAALAVWVVASPLLGIDLQVRMGSDIQDTQQVGPAAVLTVSLAASVVGWGVLALLDRHTSRARTRWTVIALVALLLSLVGPLASGVTTAAKMALALMHLSVAAVLIPLLARTSAR